MFIEGNIKVRNIFFKKKFCGRFLRKKTTVQHLEVEKQFLNWENEEGEFQLEERTKTGFLNLTLDGLHGYRRGMFIPHRAVVAKVT